MIYPIPGATGVPDSPQQFVFVVASPLPNYWNRVVNYRNSLSNGVRVHGAGMQTITAAQVPPPPPRRRSRIPSIRASRLSRDSTPMQSVYVWVNNIATNCTPLGPLGSFTTQ